MKHYSELSENTTLIYFDDLSNESKQVAMQDVLNMNVIWFKYRKFEYLKSIKNNIHSKINNKNDFKMLVNNLATIKKLVQSTKSLKQYIEQNLLEFTLDGEYIYYTPEIKYYLTSFN